MKAMILAAGRGERMRPLTDRIPKPLLMVGGHCLIEYHLQALRAAGIREIVINLAHLGARIEETLGDGRRYGVHIEYSREGDKGLETGGGIYQALPLLGAEPFVVVNADIWTDFPFSGLPRQPATAAHLVLVANPAFNGGGDFSLQDGLVCGQGAPCLTFSGIAVYRAEFFAGATPGRFSVTPMLRAAMVDGKVGGEYYAGAWFDVGTPQRLHDLDEILKDG